MSGETPTLPVAWALCERELVRFVRQRSRVWSGLLTPVLFWIVVGAGMNRSFQPPGMESGPGYLGYFFPGSVLLVVLFTAIFSTISTIEDRNAGFLQGVLAAPASRTAIALGKVLGGTILATGQGVLILPLALAAGLRLSVWGAIGAAGMVALVAFGLTSLGFVFAWRMDSVAGFHGVMNLLLMPLWLLSGALFPAAGASGWVREVIRWNPLAHGLAPMRACLGGPVEEHSGPLLLSVGVTAGFAALAFAAAAWVVRARPECG